MANSPDLGLIAASLLRLIIGKICTYTFIIISYILDTAIGSHTKQSLYYDDLTADKYTNEIHIADKSHM